MEKVIINRFNGANVKLVEIDSKYYIVDKDNDDIKYDLSNNWKYTGNDGKRYLKESSKTRIINEARARTSFDSDIKNFIDWYDNRYSLGVNPGQSETQETETNNVNQLRIEEIVGPLESKLNDVVLAVKENQKANIFEQAILDGIISKAKEIALTDLEKQVVDYAKNFVETTYGKLPTRIEIIESTGAKQIEGLFHKNFEQILQIVGQKIPLMLIGPAGSGKNHTLEQVAKALDLPFYFSNSITQEYKLTGFIDANGTYHETEFYKAFVNGGLFFFDEIDASCAESLIVINAALANGYFDFPNGRINAHENFRVVAAANTFGNGADMIYVGRNQLDGATLDRFATMEFDYDENIEKTICADDNLYNFIIAIRKAIKKRRLRFVISMRATINASKMLKAGIDKDTIVRSVITKSMRKDDINTILNEIDINNEWVSILRGIK